MDIKIKELLIKIKSEKPFILNINKYFTLDLIASGLRSIGAFPIMSNAKQEIDELLNLSKSVVINLGKLDDDFIQLCDRICQTANELKKPIILDPVGAGASHYRTETSINLIKKHKVSILRGYASEIAALLNEQLTPLHGDPNATISANENAKLLSKKYDMTVVISGRMNSVIHHDSINDFNFDSALLFKVAGIGSLLSSIIGAFHAVENNRFIAATSAVDYYAMCVGIAKNKANGPGSFKTGLIDEMYLKSSESANW